MIFVLIGWTLTRQIIKRTDIAHLIIPAKVGIRTPGSRRDLGGESPPPGDARSW